MGLPDVPEQCRPVLFGEEGLGQWRRWVSRIRVLEGGYEVGGPGALPEKFAVRAIGEASTEGSAEVGELREKMFLMLFRVGQDLAEMGWNRVLDYRVSGFFEGWAGALAYPV